MSRNFTFPISKRPEICGLAAVDMRVRGPQALGGWLVVRFKLTTRGWDDAREFTR